MKSIDDYLSEESYYCIDFIPYDAKDEAFLEYETFYEENNIDRLPMCDF